MAIVEKRQKEQNKIFKDYEESKVSLYKEINEAFKNDFEKWNLNYIKDIAGEKTVPLYDDRPVTHKDGFNEAHAKMKMSDYVDLLLSKPTNYRIFLYNLMKEVPVLKKDFLWPDIGLKLVKQLPMLFFGGENARVFMHYDIDYSNILHFNK